jgi:uncharacterized cupredoxin-like copper-binding protein
VGINTKQFSQFFKECLPMHLSKLFLTLAILLLAVILAACGPAAASTIAPAANLPQITIKTSDYAFEAPAKVEAGLVSINLINEGQEPHHAQLIRLNEGVTLEQFQGAMQESPEAALALITLAGGPGVIDPGHSQQVVVELTPGQYVLVCFVPSHDGMPHLAKGMMATMEVVAGDSVADAPEIKADATIKLLDFSFALPAQIKAGPQIWKVVNEGAQAHEFALIKLAEGKTMADVSAFMESPHGLPPFEDAGGLQAIAPGAAGWVSLDLQPGNYVALCYVPDPATGHAHLALGMVMPFSVK